MFVARAIAGIYQSYFGRFCRKRSIVEHSLFGDSSRNDEFLDNTYELEIELWKYCVKFVPRTEKSLVAISYLGAVSDLSQP